MTLLKRLEFRVKALAFGLFRVLLKKGRPERIPLDASRMTRILFLRPDRIGDTVTSLPLFDALKAAYPNVRLAVFASPKNISLIDRDPRFERIYCYRRNILHDFRQVLQIRREKFDCVVDLLADDSVTCLFLSQSCVADAPRIGVRKRRFAQYYDYTFHPGEDSELHMIDINLQMLSAFGIKPDSSGYAAPFVPSDDAVRADRFFAHLRQQAPNVPVMIGVNLSQRGPNRFWGLEKFEHLIRRIRQDYPQCRIILITAPPDRQRGDELVERLGGVVAQVEPNLGLTGISAVLARLDLLISPDTSLVHIARSFRVPVVGFYPSFKGIYRQWCPYDQPEGLVLSHGEDNIFNITADQAYEAFSRLVRKHQLVSL
ncbi:MAG: glycosyltransferase family 9 protein [candidate division Zixibacteria bacterium]|jgi:ADP-heptose:LPS heptosyltransferase|nr:glycosyltransferase family 9 protein [candidate division Zixibacteria bacterium]